MAQEYKELDVDEETPSVFRETVNTLVEMLIKPECFKRDLFFALLLVLMKENDFLLLKAIGDDTISIVDYVVTMKRPSSDIYEALFVLKGFEGVSVRLVVVAMGDVMLLTCLLPEIGHRAYSICLLVNRFFVKSRLGLPRNLTNLEELSSEFRDKIVNPVKSSILNYNKIPSSTLAGLPADVLRVLVLYLSVKDIANLSKSCKRINGIVNEDGLWSHLYSRDFPDKFKVEERYSYIDMYKKEYVKRAEKEKVVNNISSNNVSIETSGYMIYSCVPDPRLEVLL